jgi:heme O synthase-like polyprenyltransferase
VALVAGAVLLYLAVRFLQTSTEANAWAAYRASGTYLAAIVLGLVADRLLPL